MNVKGEEISKCVAKAWVMKGYKTFKEIKAKKYLHI